MDQDSNKTQSSSLEQDLWSPDVFFSNFPTREQRELMSTPNQNGWPVLDGNNEDCEGSSKIDSGYCSLTPVSGDSFGRSLDKECYICKQYEKDSPNCICKSSFENKTPSLGLGCSETIPKLTIPLSKTFSLTSEFRPIKEHYDEPMESSLYEPELQERASEDRQDCNFESMEIGEEQSIDFVESGVFLTNTTKESNKSDLEKNPGHDEDCNNFREEFFTPCANISASSIPFSSKHRNETEAQIQPSVTEKFRNAVKKVCTLNFFLHFNRNGIETVDILYQLGVKKNFPDIVTKILGYLPDRDLDTVSSVCKSWYRILKSDTIAWKRWKAYKVAMRMKRENYWSPTKNKDSGGRQTLVNITNHNSPNQDGSPCLSPNVSPRSMRFRSYQKAAKNLKQGERLLRCPKCRYPSHDKGSPNVHCSRPGCQHRFCVWCLCETKSETPHDCLCYTPLRRSTPRVPRIGSKICKRNLRRL